MARVWIIMGLLILVLAGCINYPTDSAFQPGDDEIDIQQPGPYEAFVQKIQGENLSEYGLDIVSMLEEHLFSSDVLQRLATTDITSIDYTLEKCNFSMKDASSCNDMVIKIDPRKHGMDHASSFSMTVIFAFVLNGNDQFDTILNERFEIADCKMMDITGDGRDEIILIKSRDRYYQFINILSWDAKTDNMVAIFDEMLSGYAIHPYSCDNSYQFVPARAGGYDIIFDSMIFWRSDDILETGSTRFIFNGNKYVVNGTYYDYQTRGEAIAEDVRSSKSQ